MKTEKEERNEKRKAGFIILKKEKNMVSRKKKNHFCYIHLIATEDFPFCFPLQLKEKSLNKKVAEKEILKGGLFQSF